MAEQTEQIESPLLWQELTPEEASQAVFGGYSHFANNRLTPLNCVQFYDLNTEQSKKHSRLIQSLSVNLQEAFLEFEQKSTEFEQGSTGQAVRLTAQWLKKKIEEKIKKDLELPLDEKEPAKFWFRQAEGFYFLKELSGEDRQTIKKVLEDVKTIWENLEALADPKREIKPDAKLEKSSGAGKIFNFREQLTLPR